RTLPCCCLQIRDRTLRVAVRESVLSAAGQHDVVVGTNHIGGECHQQQRGSSEDEPACLSTMLRIFGEASRKACAEGGAAKKHSDGSGVIHEGGNRANE